jgi:ATP-binding cassette subfamily B protein
LGTVSATWAQARANLERIKHLMDTQPLIRDPAVPQPIPHFPKGPSLSLKNVSFAYDGAKVLDEVSFTAEAGKTTALVGPSGAGKSTVFHLLTRLADPQSGVVELSGLDLRQFGLSDLRGQFAVVSQDSALFDETIAHNVLLGAQDRSPGDLIKALADANAAEFVDRLPEGIETQVGPRVSALSGGQRQRVAIARAILRDAPILLLDEATSALDARSEQLVTQALDRLAQGRTTLVIAHRLATVLQADKIVVMDQGRVVDQGSHTELLDRGGLYADLYRLQFKEEDAVE